MNTTMSFVGALLFTYFTRRLLYIVLRPNFAKNDLIVISNLGSFLIWAFLAGFIKVYDSSFNLDATRIYAFAQILWTLADFAATRIVTDRK